MAEWLSILRDGIAILAAGVAIYVGLVGLHTWRRQLRGRTEYETARALLRATYRFRDAVEAVRNPMMLVGEIATAFEEADIEPETEGFPSDPRTAQVVYDRRWKNLSPARVDLDTATLEAQVLWGDKAQEVVQPLRKCQGTLFSGLYQYLRYQRGGPGVQEARPKNWDRIENIVYPMGGEDDVLSNSLEEAVKGVESFLRPRMSRPGGNPRSARIASQSAV